MLRMPLRITAALVLCLVAFEGYAVWTARLTLQDRLAPFRLMDIALSEEQMDAIVRVQDPAFYSHGGIEWPSPLTRTTLTQSLVKRLFFEQFRPGLHKLEQTLIAALVVDRNVSKDLQLRIFARTAYFGHRKGQAVIGFEQAAKVWFGSRLDALSRDQFLALLAMLPAPNTLAPGSAQSMERVERIKRLLDGKCTHTEVADMGLEQCRP
jgi:monofunctional glycosyltransferase